MTELEKLQKSLQRIEKQLDKCRTSSFIDGWQTSKHAKKARKWDYYAKEKMVILGKIEDIRLGIDRSGGYIGEALNT